MTRILTIIALLFATPAEAIKYREFKKIELNELSELYLTGLEAGIGHMNSEVWVRSLRSKDWASREQRIYCPPKNLRVTNDVMRQAIDEGYRLSGGRDGDVAWLAIEGLKHIFPCNRQPTQ